jgi:hypothetical protein
VNHKVSVQSRINYSETNFPRIQSASPITASVVQQVVSVILYILVDSIEETIVNVVVAAEVTVNILRQLWCRLTVTVAVAVETGQDCGAQAILTYDVTSPVFVNVSVTVRSWPAAVMVLGSSVRVVVNVVCSLAEQVELAVSRAVLGGHTG